MQWQKLLTSMYTTCHVIRSPFSCSSSASTVIGDSADAPWRACLNGVPPIQATSWSLSVLWLTILSTLAPPSPPSHSSRVKDCNSRNTVCLSSSSFLNLWMHPLIRNFFAPRISTQRITSKYVHNVSSREWCCCQASLPPWWSSSCRERWRRSASRLMKVAFKRGRFRLSTSKASKLLLRH